MSAAGPRPLRMAACLRLMGVRRSPVAAVLVACAVVLILMTIVPVVQTYPELRRHLLRSAETDRMPYRNLQWADLASTDKEVQQRLAELHLQAAGMPDADVRADPLWLKMRELGGQAKGNPALDGQLVRLSDMSCHWTVTAMAFAPCCWCRISVPVSMRRRHRPIRSFMWCSPLPFKTSGLWMSFTREGVWCWAKANSTWP